MAAPETEKTEEASKVEIPATAAGEAPPPKPAGPPKKRKGGFLSKLLLSMAILAVLAGAAGYGALTFRNVDPRVGIAADYVEQGLAEAQGALDKAQGLVADLTGGQKPAPKAANPHALLDKAPLPPEAAPAPPAEAAVESPAPAPVEAAKEPEAPAAEKPTAETPEPKRVDVPEPPRKPAELAQQEAAPIPAPPPPPIPAPLPAPAAIEPPPPAPAAKLPDADGFTDRDLISALEGRIEALSDEVLSLRGKLDAPKSETRAAPETEVAKVEAEKPAPAPAAAPDTTSAAVVVAFALQRDLESGHPFADEIAALSRLKAEPAPAQILVDLSEKGAPTGAQLRDAFQPIAKKLKTHETHAETPHEGSDIAGHILEGASKLVKVRPAGAPHPESFDGKLDRIESALAHNDFAAALRIFESLPEDARSEAKEFGETLQQRSEAARAADELLRGAIAALGKK